MCDGSGSCTHPNEPSGTSCGDPLNTDCTNPDTCNGSGTCQPNHASSGTTCTDDDNECTNDVCNGSGSCTHPAVGNGTPCADDGNECTNDQCQGGTCSHPAVGNGTPCTDDGNECTNDQCQGGTCSHPAVGNGTPCTDDGKSCSSDSCQGGTCTHTFQNSPLALGNFNLEGSDGPAFASEVHMCSGSGLTTWNVFDWASASPPAPTGFAMPFPTPLDPDHYLWFGDPNRFSVDIDLDGGIEEGWIVSPQITVPEATDIFMEFDTFLDFGERSDCGGAPAGKLEVYALQSAPSGLCGGGATLTLLWSNVDRYEHGTHGNWVRARSSFNFGSATTLRLAFRAEYTNDNNFMPMRGAFVDDITFEIPCCTNGAGCATGRQCASGSCNTQTNTCVETDTSAAAVAAQQACVDQTGSCYEEFEPMLHPFSSCNVWCSYCSPHRNASGETTGDYYRVDRNGSDYADWVLGPLFTDSSGALIYERVSGTGTTMADSPPIPLSPDIFYDFFFTLSGNNILGVGDSVSIRVEDVNSGTVLAERILTNGDIPFFFSTTINPDGTLRQVQIIVEAINTSGNYNLIEISDIGLRPQLCLGGQ